MLCPRGRVSCRYRAWSVCMNPSGRPSLLLSSAWLASSSALPPLPVHALTADRFLSLSGVRWSSTAYVYLQCMEGVSCRDGHGRERSLTFPNEKRMTPITTNTMPTALLGVCPERFPFAVAIPVRYAVYPWITTVTQG
jgi:hypothetical protein